MNLRKTHLWVSLIVGVLVWGAYFLHFAQMMWRGEQGGLAWWFLAALAVTVLSETVATGFIAWLFRRRGRTLEEGPTLYAALQASHVALMILISLILLLAAGLAFAGLFGWSFNLASSRTQVLLANLLLGAVVVAELSRAAFTLALLPRR
ncbi:hypothetical protein [Brevundimonas lenta]|uniref:Small-conductance mechanosensitive channel n=1 Tax=Brevundimonas lenta TaxID=424796 RepID=A0A7W6JFR5_9CAUL|nr:hypothetical protein [Brevundimonas lenta]MBB4084309.1 small-conductance mechanosensitive channel [Brevundimonas lenta]